MKFLYTTREARTALGVGNTTFYRLINARKLDARRLGRRTYITAESLEGLVASLKPAMTPTMAQAEQPLGADRHSPQDRFTSLAPRPPAGE
jgi:excisionase family DNA binding protein